MDYIQNRNFWIRLKAIIFLIVKVNVIYERFLWNVAKVEHMLHFDRYFSGMGRFLTSTIYLFCPYVPELEVARFFC